MGNLLYMEEKMKKKILISLSTVVCSTALWAAAMPLASYAAEHGTAEKAVEVACIRLCRRGWRNNRWSYTKSCFNEHMLMADVQKK